MFASLVVIFYWSSCSSSLPVRPPDLVSVPIDIISTRLSVKVSILSGILHILSVIVLAASAVILVSEIIVLVFSIVVSEPLVAAVIFIAAVGCLHFVLLRTAIGINITTQRTNDSPSSCSHKVPFAKLSAEKSPSECACKAYPQRKFLIVLGLSAVSGCFTAWSPTTRWIVVVGVIVVVAPGATIIASSPSKLVWRFATLIKSILWTILGLPILSDHVVNNGGSRVPAWIIALPRRWLSIIIYRCTRWWRVVHALRWWRLVALRRIFLVRTSSRPLIWIRLRDI
jgi:hypothetical protein